MTTEAGRRGVVAVPIAAVLLLWPALWNRYPIVFADTGTYLSQAIHHYAGWDRPVFYSLFVLPLHATITLWPVVVVQALLAAWSLWRVSRALTPGTSATGFVGGIALLSGTTWLPWLVCELMPDLFTPLLVLALGLLAWTPERLSRLDLAVLMALAALMIASQQSSVPLACVLLLVLAALAPDRRRTIRFAPVARERSATVPPPSCLPQPVAPSPAGAAVTALDGYAESAASLRRTTEYDAQEYDAQRRRPVGAIRLIRRWLPAGAPFAMAVVALCTANLAAHGRFALSPFGNVFFLARVIYDGPGLAVLRRDCPTAGWRLCPFIDRLPSTSDEFLWQPDGPLNRAGGPKVVSKDAGDIIIAALRADPAGEVRAMIANSVEQLSRFGSGDGLNPWPEQVSPVIERDFPVREQAAYAAARQQTGALSVPVLLAGLHNLVAIGGVVACAVLLPVAFVRRAPCAGLLLATLVSLPLSAAITGALSAPHDRYQSRIMWLPPFIAGVSLASLWRRAG